jgi:hypothetical protein
VCGSEEPASRWHPWKAWSAQYAEVGAPVGLLELDGAASQATCSGAGNSGAPSRLEPLSSSRYRVEFTARAELRDKLERARELLSHAVPSGDLGELFERALDALIEKETRRRLGADRPRKQRQLKEDSRHIPVEIARAVWERDQGQCSFVDAEGRRCSERRFLRSNTGTRLHSEVPPRSRIFACSARPTTWRAHVPCSASSTSSRKFEP